MSCYGSHRRCAYFVQELFFITCIIHNGSLQDGGQLLHHEYILGGGNGHLKQYKSCLRFGNICREGQTKLGYQRGFFSIICLTSAYRFLINSSILMAQGKFKRTARQASLVFKNTNHGLYCIPVAKYQE